MWAYNIAGKRFARLRVIAQAGHDRHGFARWRCICDCGKKAIVLSGHLRTGHTKSCGCMKKESAAIMGRNARKHGRFSKESKAVRHANAIAKRHNMSHTPEYSSFSAAKGRCRNQNNQDWPDYGKRGIKFLFASFKDFYAEVGPRPAGTTLDRIDNDGHYEVGNVRWATASEQINNRRPFALWQ